MKAGLGFRLDAPLVPESETCRKVALLHRSRSALPAGSPFTFALYPGLALERPGRGRFRRGYWPEAQA